MEAEIPLTLAEAVATEPAWLQAWIMVLVITHLVAIFFVAYRKEGKWRVHYESLAIIGSFMAAGVFMGWLYEQLGYVRLLGSLTWLSGHRRSSGFSAGAKPSASTPCSANILQSIL